MNRMGNEQQGDTSNQAKSLPAQLALNAVLLDQGKGISKNQHGVVKADAVLAFVAFGLGFVPLEPDHTGIV